MHLSFGKRALPCLMKLTEKYHSTPPVCSDECIAQLTYKADEVEMNFLKAYETVFILTLSNAFCRTNKQAIGCDPFCT